MNSIQIIAYNQNIIASDDRSTAASVSTMTSSYNLQFYVGSQFLIRN